MSFPFDATARLVSTFRSLDEPITKLPSIAPVALLADYSRRSSSEPIECRALVGLTITPAAGGTPWVQISAPARPVILDGILLRQNNANASLGITLTVTPLVSPAPGATLLDIGGVTHTAWVQSGEWPGALAGTAVLPLDAGVFEWPSGTGLRCLIPRGRTLALTSGLSVQWEISLLLREIVE